LAKTGRKQGFKDLGAEFRAFFEVVLPYY